MMPASASGADPNPKRWGLIAAANEAAQAAPRGAERVIAIPPTWTISLPPSKKSNSSLRSSSSHSSRVP